MEHHHLLLVGERGGGKGRERIRGQMESAGTLGRGQRSGGYSWVCCLYYETAMIQSIS